MSFLVIAGILLVIMSMFCMLVHFGLSYGTDREALKATKFYQDLYLVSGIGVVGLNMTLLGLLFGGYVG